MSTPAPIDQSQAGRPPWPAWYGLAALGLALVLTVFASGVVVGALQLVGADVEADDAGLNLAATLIQDFFLAATALWLAARVARPRASQFGLRGARLWRAVKWTAIAFAIYFVFQLLYVAAFDPDQEQTTLRDLGAGDGAALTLLIGVLVVGVAPVVEEFFFRGFFFGALRTRFSFLPAALLNGLVFGGIHAPTGWQAVPPLIVLGFAFCLAYEATGSILPAIALHALNNMVAFGADDDGSWAVAGAVGALVLVGCLTWPRMRGVGPATAGLVVGLLLVTAPPALADDPAPAEQPAATAPAPAPAPARVRLTVRSGMRSDGRAYVLSGDPVTVAGSVRPYVPDQLVRVQIATPDRRPLEATARVRRAKGGAGRFRIRFRTRRAAAYSIYARHDGTDQQAQFDAKAVAHAVSARGGPGRRGIATALLKLGLRRLGYVAGAGPSWTDRLGRALMAFRKVNGMARTSRAGKRIFRMVFAGRGGFELRYPRAGKHIEADLSRQVLALAEGRRIVAVYHTSSGKRSTPTVLGRYRFYLKTPGTNAKGMYMSNYFIRGYAIHGYRSVPTYPASHGCLRIPNADANTVYDWIQLGDPIYVYR